MELARQLGWSEQDATLHHFRTKEGVEVDAVLETPDGRIAGAAFKAGVVLYTGREPLSFGDGLWAIPMSALWECCDA